LEILRKRILSTERFQPHLRQNEPDWTSELAKLRLPKKAQEHLVAELKLLWILPFADVPAVRELLLFKYTELPKVEKKVKDQKKEKDLRFCALFRLLTRMALQGSSLFPQNATHLAKRVQFVLSSAPNEAVLLEPLLDLLILESAKSDTGLNFETAADLARVVESEHQRREGVAEQGWKAHDKFDLHRQEVVESPRFKQDWDSIKRHFDIQKFRDSRGIIRRSPIPERNWQRPTQPALDVTRDRFQVAFDFFCWKWFLYGMRGDEPLVEKLTYTLTPFGTQIFIPGFWSLDYVRDINWGAVLKLHRARGIPKQGKKAAQNAKERQEQLARLIKANQEAKQRGIKGAARDTFLKQQAGLAPETDDSQVRRLLRDGK